MQTPLGELIATLSEYYYSETFPNSEKSGIKLSIDCAVQLLEKEREVIIEAYRRGGHDGIDIALLNSPTYENGSDYFTKTFTGKND